MTTLIIEIEKNTPEISKALEQLTVLSGVKIKSGRETKSAWDKAIAEGAVSVDAFFDDLNTRIEKWPSNA